MDRRTQQLRTADAAGDPQALEALVATLIRLGESEKLPELVKGLPTDRVKVLADGAYAFVFRSELERRGKLEGELAVGTWVRYTKGSKGRARASYLGSDERVAKGVEGRVTHIGQQQDHRSAYGTWSYGTSRKVRVETAEGRVFFTYGRNLEVAQTWEDADVRQRRAERTAAQQAEEWASFQRPSRGDTITMVDQNGEQWTAEVFWVGPDKRAVGALQGVAWRVGVRVAGSSKWGSGREVLRINGKPTPQSQEQAAA
jgi:hypothetical protein